MTVTDPRETLRPVTLAPGWAASALAVVPALALPALPPMAQYIPLVASVLVLGLPHGAVDHLAIARSRGEAPDWRAIARVFALYGIVGGTYAVTWFLAPAIAFVLFIAVTWFHWGQGDLWAIQELAGADHIRSLPQGVGTVVVRGGLPMLVPLLAFPDWYRRVAVDLVGLFAPGAVAAIEWAFQPNIRLALGAVYGTILVGTLSVGFLRAADTGPWRLDAAETLGLVAYFAFVPPVLAIGIYFCLWHSLRHVGRLLLVDDDATAALGQRDPVGAFGRFARDALPLTLSSLALLAGLYWLVPNPPATVPEWVGLYLVFIAVVTLPHVVVVMVMDLAEGVWT